MYTIYLELHICTIIVCVCVYLKPKAWWIDIKIGQAEFTNIMAWIHPYLHSQI